MNKNAYAFTYDPLYQLTNSEFGTLTGTSSYTFSVDSYNKHKETIGGYDKNGRTATSAAFSAGVRTAR